MEERRVHDVRVSHHPADVRRGPVDLAGLDAVENEPLPQDSPLWNFPNTVITPHSASHTDNLGGEMAKFFVENIRRFAEGEPLLGIVDRAEGY